LREFLAFPAKPFFAGPILQNRTVFVQLAADIASIMENAARIERVLEV
jgi:hypothetical protein